MTINLATNTMSIRYKEICEENDILYRSNVDDTKRTTISRWRLSSIPIKVETGRYKRPPIPRENRLCSICFIVEDEEHVLLRCPLYQSIRINYSRIFDINTNVKSILNPKSEYDIIYHANFLQEIEKCYKKHMS